jgi:hypothetical protein
MCGGFSQRFIGCCGCEEAGCSEDAKQHSRRVMDVCGSFIQKNILHFKSHACVDVDGTGESLLASESSCPASTY